MEGGNKICLEKEGRMNTPNDLKYAPSHEWLKDNGDGTATIGITEHAQDALGDVVFIELPKVGRVLSESEGFGIIESVKATSDLYAPVSGEVIEANSELESNPEIINESPFENGWIIKIKMSDPVEISKLLDAEGYQETL